MRLTTLEWAPNVASDMPEQGVIASVVRQVASQAGLETQIRFAPWSRVVQVGVSDPAYAGYFPAFYTKEREKTCYFSGVIGHTIIGFAYLKDKPLQWKKLPDLRGKTIGIVQEYVNGEDFDALVRAHVLTTDIAPSDISNLRKLLVGRVDVIVISKEVLRQLLLTDPGLQAVKEQIVFHSKELTNFSMHICFQKNERGLDMQKRFNAELGKTNTKKMENTYFQQLQASKSGSR